MLNCGKEYIPMEQKKVQYEQVVVMAVEFIESRERNMLGLHSNAERTLFTMLMYVYGQYLYDVMSKTNDPKKEMGSIIRQLVSDTGEIEFAFTGANSSNISFAVPDGHPMVILLGLSYFVIGYTFVDGVDVMKLICEYVSNKYRNYQLLFGEFVNYLHSTLTGSKESNTENSQELEVKCKVLQKRDTMSPDLLDVFIKELDYSEKLLNDERKTCACLMFQSFDISSLPPDIQQRYYDLTKPKPQDMPIYNYNQTNHNCSSVSMMGIVNPIDPNHAY